MQQKPLTHVLTHMIKNHLRIAFRNLAKNKVQSFINIAGLSVGMSVVMLIGLWISDELSFNKYHKNYDSIAQLMQRQTLNGQVSTWSSMPYPLLDELRTHYRHLFTRIVASTPKWDYVLSAGEKKITQTGQFMEDGGADLFTLKMLKGDRAGLKDPYSIFLSASTAATLFAGADPMGQVIRIGDNQDVKVTGVYEDLPQNTRLNDVKFFSTFNLYLSIDSYIKKTGWEDHRIMIYTQIPSGASFEKISAGIQEAEATVLGSLDMKAEAATHPQFWLHPMSKWHLYTDFKNGVAGNSPAHFVWLVGIIGAFILMLACINFMNLSTARSGKRAKEVGIRKAIGSLRMQLIGQFFTESFLFVLLAFLLAVLMTALSLSWFNGLAAKQMHMPWTDPWFWLGCLVFALLTGLLAGSYPAFYLSSFQPIHVLKGSQGSHFIRAGQGGNFVGAASPRSFLVRNLRSPRLSRKVLIILQFTISAILIICTIAVYRQIQFSKDRPVGYTRDGLIVIRMKSAKFYQSYDLLRTELKNTGAVAEVSQSQSPTTDVLSHTGGFTWKDKDPGMREDFATLDVSLEYGRTVGWQFEEGRDFSGGFASDSSGLVINESAARFMGLKHPVGERIRWDRIWDHVERDYTVLGVIKDMVMQSPFEPVKPTIFYLGGNFNWINIRIDPNVGAGAALPKIADVFRRIIPSVPFDYNFADQQYALKFAAEERIGKLAGFFTLLAIFICVLGLFGMASFIAEQRTKEIGVRKVLGASVFGIWQLLSKDFVLLVLTSLLIAMPLAYYFTNAWLKNYSYRTGLSWWIFAATGAGTIMITLLTVSYHSIRAALMDPARSLKSE